MRKEGEHFVIEPRVVSEPNRDSQNYHLLPENKQKIEEVLSQLTNDHTQVFDISKFCTDLDDEKKNLIEVVTCSICYNFPDDFEERPPQECASCNKLICKKCLEKLKENDTRNQCPNCRQSGDFRPINKLIKQMIGSNISLVHKCNNFKKNKGQKYTYQELFRHITDDCIKYGKVHRCPYRCDQRNKRFTKKQLRKHFEKDCDSIEFKCPRECGQFVKKIEIKTHSCMEVLKTNIQMSMQIQESYKQRIEVLEQEKKDIIKQME